MSLTKNIQVKIEDLLKDNIISDNSISGGCISDARMLKLSSGKHVFLKSDSEKTELFKKEANGLRELKRANAIRVPEVLLVDDNFILTEFIGQNRIEKNFFSNFGHKFAMMHKFTNETFGFYEDNFIGSNPQINSAKDTEAKNWVEFYFNKRLLYQYKLAEKNGYATSELREGISKLENKISDILKGSEEKPSVLHGDLWSGNFISDENGQACIIDPAVYYGHREADLAMTKLFGGFDQDFYKAYNETYPLPEGYSYRENIYKLYHVMNHLNLFGRGYYSQAISLIMSYTK